MDFVTDFLITSTAGPKVNAVLVVVDRLSKMAHFVPLWFGKGEASTEVVTKFLFNMYLNSMACRKRSYRIEIVASLPVSPVNYAA